MIERMAEPLTPGTPIDRYVVQFVLGHGGLSTVYAVKHHVLGTKHALKVLHDERPEIQAHLVREGQLQAKLDPTHIVPVTDVLIVNGFPALLMPWIEGCSLDRVLKEYRPTEGEVLSLMRDIVAGVTSAHDAGIIHRDLKPANIMVEERRGRLQVRVADFGLARAFMEAEANPDAGFMGTPKYAAPEQFERFAKIDHRTDLWSLGVILMELLNGERHDTREDLLQSVQNLGPPWRSIAESVLQEDPAQRSSSAVDLLRALEAVEGGTPLVSGNPLVEIVRRRATESSVVSVVTTPAERTQILPDTLKPGHLDNSTASKALSEQTSGALATLEGYWLPPERDPFVGRENELALLDHHFKKDHRLVTVLGIGGTGKTRFVTHYGWQHISDWSGGIWFCDLADARTVDGVLAAVSSTLGLELDDRDPVSHIGRAIAGRGKCLLILDNMEQVTRDAERALADWLDAAPGASFIVTTREVIGVPGEVVIPLAPMNEEDATDLFIQRARMAKPNFQATPQDVEAIGKLVDLLDRLPLAIELAAARVRVLAPVRLLDRMSDRFKVLTSRGGRRDRQATLRATLDWSWNLLNDWEKSALAQLSVFDGGFDLDAVEEVVDLGSYPDAPWAMDAAQALVDKSLVRVTEGGRMSLLVSVQEYAREQLDKLGLRQDTEARHMSYYTAFGTPEAIQSLHRRGGESQFKILKQEGSNVAGAVRNAIRHQDAESAMRGLAALWAIVDRGGSPDLIEGLLEEVTPMIEPDSALFANRHLLSAQLLRRRGRSVEALATVDRLLSGEQPPHVMMQAYVLRSDLRSRLGSPEDAESWLKAALEVEATSPDQGMQGLIYRRLGAIYTEVGEFAEAEKSFRIALAVNQKIGDRPAEADTLGGLGTILKTRGKTEEALVAYRKSLNIHLETGHRVAQARTLSNMGALSAALGKVKKATSQYEQALTLHRELGSPMLHGITLFNRGLLYLTLDELALARVDVEQSLDIMRLCFPTGAGVALGALALIEAREGNLEAAERALQEGEPLVRQSRFQVEVAKFLQKKAWVNAIAGNEVACQEAIGEAEVISETLGGGDPDLAHEMKWARDGIRAALTNES